MTRNGTFREDLYYRINVITIWLPPLRERGEDVERLACHFCRIHGRANGKPGLTFETDALALLRAQPWPGNVRQLQNFVERLVVLGDGPTVRATDVERELLRQPDPSAPPGVPAGGPSADTGSLEARRRETEREAVLDALRRCGNNRTQAARVLGISRRTFYNKLEEHGVL
jgi:two-component system response regulator AtoC